MASFIGRRLAHYQIVDRLGAGGMGEVYRAHDDHLERDVAIKLIAETLFDEAVARARLLREARAAAALNHPNICTIYEVGQADDQTYIAMELIEGLPLSARVAKGALPASDVLHYARQIAEALEHAHNRGVVHRDLKSANIIVTPEGRVKVLDFGLAKRFASSSIEVTGIADVSLTEPGMVVGTLAYMSPEQFRGQVADARSDVWALGVVLYELATGSRPFRGQNGFELSASILNDAAPPLPPASPAALRAVVARCLEKDPDRRYEHASDVRAALETTVDGSAGRPSVLAGSTETTGRVASRVTRRRALAIGAAAALLIAGGVGAWLFWQRDSAIPSLAILPLQNVAKNEEVDYLCQGLSGGLIRQVSRLSSLNVMPLRAGLNVKNNASDIREVGRQLGVNVILAGTLEQELGRLRITLMLTDVASGKKLWDDTFSGVPAEMMAIQDEIARGLVDKGLKLRLTNEERSRFARSVTENAEAYDLYMKALYLQRQSGEDMYFEASRLLRRAIVLDDKFVLPYMAMAGLWAQLAVDGIERPTEAWPQVHQYAQRALNLDPDTDGRGMIAAEAFFFNWDWETAGREWKKFMDDRGVHGDSDALRAYTIQLWALGRAKEAVEVAKLLRQTDPLSPEFMMIEADYHAAAGELGEAVRLYEESIRARPESPLTYFGLAEAQSRLRRFDEAIATRRRVHELLGGDELKEILATARGEEGYRALDRAWARLQLDDLLMRTKTGSDYVSPLDFARLYAQLAQRDQAFKYLDQAFVDQSPGLVFLNVDRAWDLVRDDPRFAAAVRRVGLPKN